MARSIMILLLAFVMFVTGCVGARPRGDDGDVKVACHHEDGPVKAEKLHGGGGEAVLLLVYGIIILGAIILDCIILPATGPCGDPFCCTQAIVVGCCHR
jgi:hypothetical protein